MCEKRKKEIEMIGNCFLYRCEDQSFSSRQQDRTREDTRGGGLGACLPACLPAETMKCVCMCVCWEDEEMVTVETRRVTLTMTWIDKTKRTELRRWRRWGEAGGSEGGVTG